VGIETSTETYLKTFALLCHNIYFSPLFVVNNSDEFLINSEIQDINTRHGSNLQVPSAHLGVCQRGDYYSGIKIVNSLPFKMKIFLII
jgi:hypothetical protein